MFNRVCVKKNGLEADGRVGDGFLTHLSKVEVTSDGAADVLTANQIIGGLFVRNGMTAGRSSATDTAVNILAALDAMDVGDTFMFRVMTTTAFALTITGGTGVTVSRGVVPAYTSATGVGGTRDFLLTKISATTITIDGI